MLPMSVVPRVGRGAAAIGLGILLTAAQAAGAPPTPVPTRAPVPVRTPAAGRPAVVPLVSSPHPVDAGAISDVALLKLAEKVGPITSITNAGDLRLFLTLRNGRILIWNRTRLLRGTFLDLRDRVSAAGTGGLFSVAFDPAYASNGLFFVSYTDRDGNLVLARYRRTSKNRADPKSGVVLLTVPFPSDSDHYGGALAFGPDGFLYAGIGDGGSAVRLSDDAQRDDVLRGKILRLDVDGKIPSPPFYRIPPSNPFAGGGARGEIWAKGLRDPWRFSFDWLTGDLYIGDVGQGASQEIDFQPASSSGGENYGWPAPAPVSADLRRPILTYADKTGCAVVGGYVYRGSRDARLAGVYFYGDYCAGFIWGRGQVTNVVAPKLTTFGEDSAGEIYAGTESGVLYRLASTFPSAMSPASVSPAAAATRQTPYEPPPPPFEFDFRSEPSEPTYPVGTFEPPRIESPFAPPAPIYAPEAPQDAPPPEEPALEDQTPPDQPSAPTPAPSPPPPPPPTRPPGHDMGPDRLSPAPPPERPTPRVVEPHG